LETVKGHFQSLSQAATCYYQSNHSYALPTDTPSKLIS